MEATASPSPLSEKSGNNNGYADQWGSKVHRFSLTWFEPFGRYSTLNFLGIPPFPKMVKLIFPKNWEKNRDSGFAIAQVGSISYE